MATATAKKKQKTAPAAKTSLPDGTDAYLVAAATPPKGKKKIDTVTSTATPSGIREHDPDALPIVHGPAGEAPPATEPIALNGLERSYVGATVRRELVRPSAGNPRRTFDEGKLQELAGSIQAQGLLSPLLVRPMGDGPDYYELIAGARRLRACELLALEAVPVRMVELSDAEAAEARLVENLQREDLSAIEEAAGLQAMLAEHGYSQVQLAATLGCTQGHISNRLRLLKLPTKWQQRVISGEIPSGHARHLVKYAEVPEVLEEVERAFFGPYPDPLGNDEEFKESLEEILSYELCPLVGSEYEGHVGKNVEYFTPTPAERKKLQIVAFDDKEYARNRKLWTELRKKQIAALVADKPAGKGKKAAAVERPERTPAEERSAAKKLEKQFAKRLAEWRANWLRHLLSLEMMDNPRLALAAVVMRLTHYAGVGARERVVELLDCSTKQLDEAMAGHKSPAEILVQLAADWLWFKDEPRGEFGDEEVEALARAAKIDLEKAWRGDLAGPLSEAYFNLHTKSQLQAIAEELGVTDAANQVTKPGTVAELLKNAITRNALPAEIKRIVGAPGTKAAKSPKKKPAAKVKKKAAATKRKKK